jgi:hypothetical protein
MTTYNVRRLRPSPEPNFTPVEATSPEAAADTYYNTRNSDGYPTISFFREVGDAKLERVKYALIEIEGHGEFVARSFHSGIWRRGARPNESLSEKLNRVVVELGWEHDPSDLLGEWDLEEDEWE